MATKDVLSSSRRVVVKLGTNLLTGGADRLDEALMSSLVSQAAALSRRGVQVVLVSSGAVAAGKQTLGAAARGLRPRDVAYRQVLAALGQAPLMSVYARLFDEQNTRVAQLLLTRVDLEDRLRYLNVRNLLERLLKLGVVPIVNENDVVSVEELENEIFGDNDRLSAVVANVANADLLILLGTVEGLYTANPEIDPAAELVPFVDEIDARIAGFAGKAIDGRSRGGMVSKVAAARIATAVGAPVVIASGRTPDVLPRLLAGERIGTRFEPAVGKVEGRKRWLLTGVFSNRGTVTVDMKAANALVFRGRSLLPVGITAASGSFDRGDIIGIRASNGQEVAWGLANYAVADVVRIKGMRSQAALGLLQNYYGPEVVHRDVMALADNAENTLRRWHDENDSNS